MHQLGGGLRARLLPCHQLRELVETPRCQVVPEIRAALARRVPAGTALYLSLDPGLALVDLGADFELELLRLVLAGLDLLLDPGLALIDLGADFVLDRFDVLLDLGESFGTLLLEIVPETYLPSTV